MQLGFGVGRGMEITPECSCCGGLETEFGTNLKTKTPFFVLNFEELGALWLFVRFDVVDVFENQLNTAQSSWSV